MEARKWEELPIDCMVDILGRVGLESLLIDVPFVCKSWYKASLSPLCWKQLDFPHISGYLCLDDPSTSRFERQYVLQGEICTTKFVKGVVDRSAGCATLVKLPSCYTEEALTYVADKCPGLKILVIHSSFSSAMFSMPFVIGKLKNLEGLGIESGLVLKDIDALRENSVALFLATRGLFANFGEEEVMAIVSCLPKIKGLSLKKVSIKRENLIKILKGCGELKYLDVGDCRGFDENDEEILKLASHIPTFKCSGSVVFHPLDPYFYDDYEDYIVSPDADLDCYSD